MKFIKSYNLFESYSNFEDLENDVKDIFIELQDDGLQVGYSRLKKDVESNPEFFNSKIETHNYLEVYINRPYGSQPRVVPSLPTPPGGKYSGDLFFWYEIKESVERLTEWYYSQTQNQPIEKNPNAYRWEKAESPLRFFGSGIEMCVGFTKAEDFSEIKDSISFTNFRIEIKV